MFTSGRYYCTINLEKLEIVAMSPVTTMLERVVNFEKVLIPNQLRNKSVGTKLFENNQSTLASWGFT